MKITVPGKKNSEEDRKDIYERVCDFLSVLWENVLVKPLIVLFFVIQILLALFFALVMPFYLFFESHQSLWVSTVVTLVIWYATFLVGYFWFRVYEESDL